jgi:hydrogenase nickel insertion protein HypA
VLEIGQFSGVEVGPLEFAFGVFKKGTILEYAEIEVLTPPLLLLCKRCENEYLADFEDLRCPTCLDQVFDILQGQDLMVKSIVGETNEQ